MTKAEALENLHNALADCIDAGIKLGVRPAAWIGRIEIVIEGVRFDDGNFVDMLEVKK